MKYDLTKVMNTFAMSLIGITLSFAIWTSGALDCLSVEPYEPRYMKQMIERETEGVISTHQAAELTEWRRRMNQYLVRDIVQSLKSPNHRPLIILGTTDPAESSAQSTPRD